MVLEKHGGVFFCQKSTARVTRVKYILLLHLQAEPQIFTLYFTNHGTPYLHVQTARVQLKVTVWHRHVRKAAAATKFSLEFHSAFNHQRLW